MLSIKRMQLLLLLALVSGSQILPIRFVVGAVEKYHKKNGKNFENGPELIETRIFSNTGSG